MIEVFIEVEAGCRDKKLYDEETLRYKDTRRVMQPYPFPYGFVLGTRCQDGECVDCYILTSEESSRVPSRASIEIVRNALVRQVRWLL